MDSTNGIKRKLDTSIPNVENTEECADSKRYHASISTISSKVATFEETYINVVEISRIENPKDGPEYETHHSPLIKNENIRNSDVISKEVDVEISSENSEDAFKYRYHLSPRRKNEYIQTHDECSEKEIVDVLNTSSENSEDGYHNSLSRNNEYILTSDDSSPRLIIDEEKISSENCEDASEYEHHQGPLKQDNTKRPDENLEESVNSIMKKKKEAPKYSARKTKKN